MSGNQDSEEPWYKNPEFEEDGESEEDLYGIPFTVSVADFGRYGNPFVRHPSGKACFVDRGYHPADKPKVGDSITVIAYARNTSDTTLFGEMLEVVQKRVERKQLVFA